MSHELQTLTSQLSLELEKCLKTETRAFPFDRKMAEEYGKEQGALQFLPQPSPCDSSSPSVPNYHSQGQDLHQHHNPSVLQYSNANQWGHLALTEVPPGISSIVATAAAKAQLDATTFLPVLEAHQPQSQDSGWRPSWSPSPSQVEAEGTPKNSCQATSSCGSGGSGKEEIEN